MKYGAAIIIFLLLSSFRMPFQVDDWLLQREKKGIKVFTRKSTWSKLKDSRAVMTIHATADEVIRLITDVNQYPKWLPRCKSARIVAHINPNEFLVYICYDLPWPVADRDCVSRMKISREVNGTTTITSTCEPKFIKEENGVVRVTQMVGKWKITPRANGVEVMNEYSSDPGGSLPDWLINSHSVDNPYEMFSIIQEKMAVSKP